MIRHPTHPSGAVPLCPSCGSCKVLRSDTGMCDPCTAKTATARQAWQQTRQRHERPAPAPRERLCMVCHEPLGELTDAQHRPYCADRKFSCPECGRRFYLSSDRAKHRRNIHHVTY